MHGSIYRFRAVLICAGLLGAVACSADDETGVDAADAADPTTTTERPEPAADAELSCSSNDAPMRIDDEIGDPQGAGHIELVSVALEFVEDDLRVTWVVSEPVPRTLTAPDGDYSSALWSINLSDQNGEPTAWLEILQEEDEVSGMVYDFEGSATQSYPIDTVSVSGTEIQGVFPLDLFEVQDRTWYALTEGDGEIRQDMGFEMPENVQHRCPAFAEGGIFQDGEKLVLG